jgi:hypothetical protein
MAAPGIRNSLATQAQNVPDRTGKPLAKCKHKKFEKKFADHLPYNRFVEQFEMILIP